MNSNPNPLNDAQYKPLQCAKCLKHLFEPVQCGPLMQNRLDPKDVQYVQGHSWRCFSCGENFNVNEASSGTQEILPS